MITTRVITSPAPWNQFVRELSPNTFLQSYEWGQLQQEMGEGVRTIGLFENDRQIGAALLIFVRARRGQHWLCPHGPLLRDQKYFQSALEALVHYVRTHDSSLHGVALRVAPLTVTTPESLTALQTVGFRPAPLHVHTELTWMLDITPTDDLLLQNMRKTTRHAIQKAQDIGVTTETVTPAEAVARFIPLYEQTKQRHGFVPFPTRYLEAQVRIFSHENQVFCTIARYHGQDVAGAIVMHVGNRAFYHHGASRKMPGNVPASHLLQWYNIQEAKRRGCVHYNFWGIAPDTAPKHPFAGITVFKKGFGGYAVAYLHAHDLPLSSRYWMLWATEQVRKWKRGF